MTAMSNEHFAQHVLQLAKSAQPFKPTATYDRDGDCIEFLVKPDPFYAERMDDLVTVYYSQETNEIIGSLIKGVTPFCQKTLKKLPGFRIIILDGRVKLEHIFLARLWSRKLAPDDLVAMTYKRLIKVAADTDAQAEMCFA
jgi:hypothetical protein